MTKSRITGCALPAAWRRAVFSALRSGRPASIAVASSRTMFASSTRLSDGRPSRRPEIPRSIAPRSTPSGFVPAARAPAVRADGAAASASEASSTIGTMPWDWRMRIAAPRSAAVTVPAATAPPRSMDWCR
jgi:hypothetical protein